MPRVTPRLLDRWRASAVLRRTRANLQHGQLTLIDDGRAAHDLRQAQAECALRHGRTLHDPRFYSEIAFGGTIGAAEAYMHGHWTCDDLTALVRMLLRNRAVLDGMDGGLRA